MYMKFADLLVSSKLLISTFLVYIPMLSFFVLLVSTMTDNANSTLEQVSAVHTRLRTEANDLLNKLNEMRNQHHKKATIELEPDDSVKAKKAAFAFYGETFSMVLKIRFKRDIPNLIEHAFRNILKVQQCVIYEVPNEKGVDYKVRNIWGLAESETAIKTAAQFRKCDITLTAADRKQALTSDDLKRQANLYEAYDKFVSELFPLEWVLPVTSGEHCLYVIYVGKQSSNALPTFTYQLVEPVLTCAVQAIIKMSSKDARPSFSSFSS
jgi:hypothetical protein